MSLVLNIIKRLFPFISRKKVEADIGGQLKNSLNAIAIYYWWKDLKGRYLGCNQRAAEMLGLNSEAEIIGKTDYDLPWAINADALVANDKLTIKTKKVYSQEEEATDAHGNVLTFLVTKAPLLDDNQKVIGVIGTSIDITKQKENEKKLRKAKELAEVASRVKSDFIKNMRHDLRTPLNGIIGLSRILYDKSTDIGFKSDINDILQSSYQLLSLLNQIIDYVEIESGKIPLRSESFHLQTVIFNLITLLQPSLQAKALHFELDYSKDLPEYVISDEMRLHRIALNILSNAIKFTPNGGDIRFSIRKIAENQGVKNKVHVEFVVKDTGKGFDPDQKELIFQTFTRGTPTYQNAAQGSGLGLAIASQFVKELKGEIFAHSELGTGSVFKFILWLEVDQVKADKLEDDHLIEEKNESKSSNKTFLNSDKRILLVEDNPLAIKIISHDLQELGYDIDLAKDGATALLKAAQQRYDLILMDIGLPDENGFSVIKKIRANRTSASANSLIIVQSAHLDQHQREASVELDIQEFLEKPISKAQIEKTLSRILN